MILHPAVVAKAQREIDTVIGDARLPNFSDRASLPYIDCILSECLRWAAPVPLGITLALLLRNSLLFTFCIGLPHRLMEDDVYENMYIPKGSVVRFTSDCHSLGCADLRAQDHCQYMVKTTVCGISPLWVYSANFRVQDHSPKLDTLSQPWCIRSWSLHDKSGSTDRKAQRSAEVRFWLWSKVLLFHLAPVAWGVCLS